MGIITTQNTEAANDVMEVSRSIKIFNIENKKGTRLVVSNYGAAVISLFIKDKNGELKDVVLGYDNAEDYLNDEFYLGTVVGRYANRIAGSSVLIDDEFYTISTRSGGYHHHGGDVGFNKKYFDAFPLPDPKQRGIMFTYTSPHLEEGFPGKLRLTVVYLLNDEDEWTVEYKAITDKTTLVNFTQHVYFNLSGSPSKGISNHKIKINSKWYLPVNKLQVPTGEFAEVNNTVFDFTKMKGIIKDIQKDDEQLKLSYGYDHSFVLEKIHTPVLKHAASVKEDNTGLIMNVYTTEPALHLYTGNFLENIKGKNKITYNKHAGFCMETQHFPDAPNHAHFPSTVLKPGEEFYSKTVFKFSAEG